MRASPAVEPCKPVDTRDGLSPLPVPRRQETNHWDAEVGVGSSDTAAYVVVERMRWISEVVETSGDQGNGRDYSAARFDDLAADDPFHRPISAFDEDIRLQCGDQALGVRFVEQDHIIDTAERGDHFRPLSVRDDRPIRRLVQTPDGRIAVDGDDKQVTQVFRSLEVARMAHVHEIETAVGKDDPFLLCAGLLQERSELVLGHDFRGHGPIIPAGRWKEANLGC